MAKPHKRDQPDDQQGGVPRRKFIQGALVASAATSVAGWPTPVAATPAAAPVQVLTAGQKGLLTTVLNRLVPAKGSLAGAGELGLAEFIDRALGVAPHLRRHIVGVLAGLPDAPAFGFLSDTAAERLLRRVEAAQPEAFDILVQVAPRKRRRPRGYTPAGYYSHPQVLVALGVDAAALEHQFDRFDVKLLDEVERRVVAPKNA